MPQRKVVDEHIGSGVSDGVFMSSRDGIHWHRTFMEAFLRPGRDRDRWRERSNFIIRGVVPTAPDELSIYWLEHFRCPTCRLRRGTLRMDGFVSINAPYSAGEAITYPLQFQGRELVLNYVTSGAGSIRIEIQNLDGKPIPGFGLSDCAEIYGDEIEGVVNWKNGSDVSRLVGRPIQLRLVLRDADVYAMRFRA